MQDSKPFVERTIGVTPEIQGILDKIYEGADASAAKDYLNEYIWVALWSHVNKLANVDPTFENLMEQRSNIKACLRMAQDLKLEMASAKAASQKLKEIYDRAVK